MGKKRKKEIQTKGLTKERMKIGKNIDREEGTRK
jgi:hypothetical protein